MSPKKIARALAGFGAAALIILLIATVWIVRHRSAAQVLETSAGLVPGTLLRAHNFHWTQMKAGERQWVLTAGEADYAADKTTLKLIDAVVTMVSTDGKPVVVNAPHADLTLNGNHVTRAYLTGGTVIHFGDYVLSTDSATFMPDDDRVEAPGLVTVVGDGLKVTGVGLIGHPKTRVFQLNTQVETVVTPKKDSEKSKQS
ncbi:MAG: LPS export ABC transporter periplasmic protein LptC [Candidatus Binatus sp.]|uniref:LPS export ABC transporter periplasmic protein LptC n=1 Tax=Candidatus Binatus sp. TaxID=2811406 RepID=UPI003C771055